MPGFTWGRMGAVGYQGSDERYLNYNKATDYEIVSNEHSDMFEHSWLAYFAPRIVRAVQQRAA